MQTLHDEIKEFILKTFTEVLQDSKSDEPPYTRYNERIISESLREIVRKHHEEWDNYYDENEDYLYDITHDMITDARMLNLNYIELTNGMNGNLENCDSEPDLILIQFDIDMKKFGKAKKFWDYPAKFFAMIYIMLDCTDCCNCIKEISVMTGYNDVMRTLVKIKPTYHS